MKIKYCFKNLIRCIFCTQYTLRYFLPNIFIIKGVRHITKKKINKFQYKISYMCSWDFTK